MLLSILHWMTGTKQLTNHFCFWCLNSHNFWRAKFGCLIENFSENNLWEISWPGYPGPRGFLLPWREKRQKEVTRENLWYNTRYIFLQSGGRVKSWPYFSDWPSKIKPLSPTTRGVLSLLLSLSCLLAVKENLWDQSMSRCKGKWQPRCGSLPPACGSVYTSTHNRTTLKCVDKEKKKNFSNLDCFHWLKLKQT